MSKDYYGEIFLEKFRYLVSEFGCKVAEKKSDMWFSKIIYKNSTTGISITYEIQDAYIHIILYKLINGEIIRNTNSAIQNDEKLNGISLDYIINQRNPDALVKPAYEYGKDSGFFDETNGLKNYVSKFAENLRLYAGDVLNGDFSIFDELDSVVKEKIRSLENK